MKTKEVPEKIYRTTTYLDGDRGKTLWKTKPVAGAENIEYTRTDAFINKACDWLERNVDHYTNGFGFVDYELTLFLMDFKNQMKGE